MKLHTFEEVKCDIENFESVKIGESPVPGENFRFLKLYSECFSDPLHVSLIMDDLKNRINGYFTEQSLKACDVWPDDSHNFYVYNATNLFDQDGGLVLLGTAETKEKAMGLMCSDDVENKTTNVCVVSTQTKEIMYFDKTLH